MCVSRANVTQLCMGLTIFIDWNLSVIIGMAQACLYRWYHGNTEGDTTCSCECHMHIVLNLIGQKGLLQCPFMVTLK